MYPPSPLVEALASLVGTNYFSQPLSAEALSAPAYPWHSTCALLVLAAPPDPAAVRKYVELGCKVLALGAGVTQSANALHIADGFGIDFYPDTPSQDTVQFEGAQIPVSRVHPETLDVDEEVIAHFTSDCCPAGIISQGGHIAVWSCPSLHETLLRETILVLGLRLGAYSTERVKTNLGRGEDMSGICISRSLDYSDQLATPFRVSELEATQYYWGLHSNPRLIARTGGPWYPPFGPEAYPKAKELRSPGVHKLLDVWEDDFALKVHDILNQNLVNWSSTEIVRIAYVDQPEGNLILWIGVYTYPNRLSYDVGMEVAVQCKRLLLSHHFCDVDVELRESNFVQSASPALLKPTDLIDPTAIVREPFTTTLGMSICAESSPGVEGTVGFFMAVNGVDKLYGVTARHVLFRKPENNDFERTKNSQPRHNVQLLSDAAFEEHLAFIQKEIDGQDIIIASQESRMTGLIVGHGDIGAQTTHKDAKDEKWKAKRGKKCPTTLLQEIKQKISSPMSRFLGRTDSETQAIHEDAKEEKSNAEKRKEGLTIFLQEIKQKWSSPQSRILGHVKFSPKIIVGAGNPEQQFTQDIAVFEVETSKITPANFPGNFIDLGTKYSEVEFTRKMHPNPANPHHFTWPGNRLLKLWGTIPMEEMRNPMMLDQNGDPCITVLKRGRTTNVTVGKVLRVIAYVRKYFTEDDTAVSKELAVIPLDKKSGPFSAKGDSGAVVVDGKGRIAGILTGGGGATDSCDVTYVTPIDFILGVIRQCKPLSDAFIKNA